MGHSETLPSAAYPPPGSPNVFSYQGSVKEGDYRSGNHSALTLGAYCDIC